MKKILIGISLIFLLSGCTTTVRADKGQLYKVTFYTPEGKEIYYATDYTCQDDNNNSVIINVKGQHILYAGFYKVEVIK